MSVLDYHYKILCQDIWQPDELRLRTSVRDNIAAQVRTRFQNNLGVYIVGDLVGHYYDSKSDLDVLIRVDTVDQDHYAQESIIASGWYVYDTEHQVNFYVVPKKVVPDTIIAKFGPLYDVTAELWIGKHVGATSELASVRSLSAWVNWNLYKYKTSTEVHPCSKARIQMVLEAFATLKPVDRANILSNLKMTIHKLDRNISTVIKVYNEKSAWKLAEEFESKLGTWVSLDLVDTYTKRGLPKQVAVAVLNKFRYVDLLNQFEKYHENLLKTTKYDDLDKLPRILVTSSVQGDQIMGNELETSGISHVTGYAVIAVSGSPVDLSAVKPLLVTMGIEVDDSSVTSILLRDVMQQHLGAVESLLHDNNLLVVGLYGERKYLKRTSRQIRKALTLSLQTGKWYFSDKTDSYPFVMVRESTIQRVADADEEIQMLELDLYDIETFMPVRQIIAAPDVALLGLRPATIEDFAERNLVPPASDQLVVASIRTASPDYNSLQNFEGLLD